MTKNNVRPDQSDFQFQSILRTAGLPCEVVAEVFRRLKVSDPKLSVLAFGRRLGVKAATDDKIRNLTSDILHGRRKVPSNFAQKLCRLANFHVLERMTFSAFVESHIARKTSARAEARVLFESLKKSLPSAAMRSEIESETKSDAMSVLAAFSAAHGGALVTQSKLRTVFGVEWPERRVDAALRALLGWGAIRKVEGGFAVGDYSNLLSDAGVHKHRLAEACNKLDRWFSRSEEAMFMTLTLPLRDADQRRCLEGMRRAVVEIASKFDCEHGAGVLMELNLTAILVSVPAIN